MKNDPLEALKMMAEPSQAFDYATAKSEIRYNESIAQQAIPQLELIMEFVEAFDRYEKLSKDPYTPVTNEWIEVGEAWQKLKEGMDNG